MMGVDVGAYNGKLQVTIGQSAHIEADGVAAEPAAKAPAAAKTALVSTAYTLGELCSLMKACLVGADEICRAIEMNEGDAIQKVGVTLFIESKKQGIKA